MAIARLSRAASVNDAVGCLDQDGAVIIENLLGPDDLRQLHSELEPVMARTPLGEGAFFGRRTRRTGRLFLKAPCSQTLATNTLALGAACAVLGENCSRVQLNLSQAIRIEPGERPQILHRDDELYPVEKGGVEYMINAIWAYDDFTEANGATQLVPGSHRERLDRDPPPDRVCVAEMPKGSVLLYLGSVLHGGGANWSRESRTGIAFSYCLGWLRQAENQYLAYPPAVAQHFPPEIQELIGYTIHEPNLGWYEGQPPQVVLGETVPDLLPARDNVPSAVAEFIEARYRDGNHSRAH